MLDAVGCQRWSDRFCWLVRCRASRSRQKAGCCLGSAQSPWGARCSLRYRTLRATPSAPALSSPAATAASRPTLHLPFRVQQILHAPLGLAFVEASLQGRRLMHLVERCRKRVCSFPAGFCAEQDLKRCARQCRPVLSRAVLVQNKRRWKTVCTKNLEVHLVVSCCKICSVSARVLCNLVQSAWCNIGSATLSCLLVMSVLPRSMLLCLQRRCRSSKFVQYIGRAISALLSFELSVPGGCKNDLVTSNGSGDKYKWEALVCC